MTQNNIQGKTDTKDVDIIPHYHPPHLKNSIPFPQYLILRRLWCDWWLIFPTKQRKAPFFKTHDYTRSFVNTGRHCSQPTVWQSAPQRHRRKRTREFHSPSPFVYITVQPEKHPFFQNFKLLENDPETSDNFFHDLNWFHQFTRDVKKVTF